MSGIRPLSEILKVDDGKDLLVVGDVPISGALLRAITEPTPEGVWFRIVRKIDGTLELKTNVSDEIDRANATVQ